MEKVNERRLIRQLKQGAARVEERRQFVSRGYGICDKCRSMFFRGYDLSREKVTCERLDYSIPLDKTNPVRVCTYFDERMKLELSDLWMMATLIDVNKKEIGFGLSNTEVEATPTEELEIDLHEFY